MIHQNQNGHEDENFSRQAQKIDQHYDMENQQGQLKDEYNDMYQINAQTNQENLDHSSANSKRKASISTNHDQNISINLNDSKSLHNIQKGNKPAKVFELEQPYKYKRYLGNTRGCLNYKGEPLITIGPHFYLFMITWSCMIAFSWFLVNRISQLKGETWYYLTLTISLVQSSSYLLTALINPGIHTAKVSGVSDPTLNNYCQKCDINQATGDYHCPDCEVCIKDFDHHCPWTGKCIGGGNMISFKIFLTATLFWFFYSIILLIL